MMRGSGIQRNVQTEKCRTLHSLKLSILRHLLLFFSPCLIKNKKNKNKTISERVSERQNSPQLRFIRGTVLSERTTLRPLNSPPPCFVCFFPRRQSQGRDTVHDELSTELMRHSSRKKPACMRVMLSAYGCSMLNVHNSWYVTVLST